MFHCSLSDSFRLCRDSKAGHSGLLIYGSFHICFIRAKQLKGLPSTLFKKKKNFLSQRIYPCQIFSGNLSNIALTQDDRAFFVCVSSSVSSIKTLSKMMLIYYKCHSLMGRGVLWKHFGGTNLNPLFFVFFLHILLFFLLFQRRNFLLATYHSFVIIAFIIMIYKLVYF